MFRKLCLKLLLLVIGKQSICCNMEIRENGYPVFTKNPYLYNFVYCGDSVKYWRISNDSNQ